MLLQEYFYLLNSPTYKKEKNKLALNNIIIQNTNSETTSSISKRICYNINKRKSIVEIIL